jgi:hypothetical protein
LFQQNEWTYSKMSFNRQKAEETSSDGLLIEGGTHIISGSASPVGLISPTFPTHYLRTNGEIWYHTGTGSWTMIQSGNSQIDGGNAFSNYGGTAVIDGGGA